jgi:hypothetical protein
VVTDEKIEAMFQLIHEENKVIMDTILSAVCYPKDYDIAAKGVRKEWDEVMMEVMRMK